MRIAAALEEETVEQLGQALEVIQNCGMKRAVAQDFYIRRAEAPLVFLVFYIHTLQMRHFFPEQKQQIMLNQLSDSACSAVGQAECHAQVSLRNCERHDKLLLAPARLSVGSWSSG
jgi:hypothetical protein